MNGVIENNKNVALNGYNGPRISDERCAYAFNSPSSKVKDISQVDIHIVDTIGKREQRVFYNKK